MRRPLRHMLQQWRLSTRICLLPWRSFSGTSCTSRSGCRVCMSMWLLCTQKPWQLLWISEREKRILWGLYWVTGEMYSCMGSAVLYTPLCPCITARAHTSTYTESGGSKREGKTEREREGRGTEIYIICTFTAVWALQQYSV
jgi:hypothetical protein